MAYKFIRSDEELREFLKSIRGAKWIALDTEFVSESKHRFQLCLIQVATEEAVVLIDPLATMDLTPFWKRLCDERTMVIVHAARSEMEFCFKAIGRVPANLFDVQLAAGFVESDYPQSFKHLGERILNLDFSKMETRTDWHRRPLSLLQLDYAINDVCYLHKMAERLRQRLEMKGRYDWFLEETRDFLQGLLDSFTREPWLRLSGIRNLSPRQLAIVRDLSRWRKEEAARSHKSPGQILRDDLLVELAKRQLADPARILAVRGLERLRKNLVGISEVISKSLELEEDELPAPLSISNYPQYTVVTQLLQAALTNFAKENEISVSLLAPVHDIRDYVARYYETLPPGRSARLAAGWRAEIVGPLLTDLIQGKLAVRLSGKPFDSVIELVPLPDDF